MRFRDLIVMFFNFLVKKSIVKKLKFLVKKFNSKTFFFNFL